ncbi:UTP--glucose-1-phosphate uridylyltransferase-like isoform X1 [Gossypium australe]|uniref:UTP--glucose-1-phosphate uridylyltransferase n=1 Tax=Gossypium australe TaxID=47621 RepID=A0A5B6VUY0_9ROSI|nr:UTP--glucose-1-phosphate uridylyltransferase-like isoform X1 [Gossypium australe]
MTIHSVVIQKLLTTNAHIGRQVTTHHFKQFTYGFRNRQSIIDSDKTLICLRNALNFLSCLSRDPSSSFLFINTNPLFQPIINEMTSRVTSLSPERASSLWKMRGFLTNSCSPKKFRSRHKKLVFAPTKMPDCVVIFDTERKSSVFLEAERLGIPIVALVDSSMPWEYYKKVTYPIPANDSVQFVYLICNMITKCLMLEKKKDGAKGTGKKATIKVGFFSELWNDRDQVESTSESEGSASDEVLVVPYDNLAPMSCADIAESKQLLDKLVVVKYNGALGKNMGFGGPKSLIEVKNGSTPLDLIVNQIQSLNSKYGCNIPLLLMNPKNTHNDIVKALEKYSTLDVDIHPFEQGEHTQLESFVSEGGEDKWQSSKHGAHFLSLMNSGTLDVLLAQGKEYALVVNPDNVAGVVDPSDANHRHCLKTSLQITLKRWLNLKAIKRLVDTSALNLDNLSTLKLFENSIGISIPQSRFLPLNSTSDLFLLQSDLYSFTEGMFVRNDARVSPSDPSIALGPEFEKISDFKRRFETIPSIVKLDSLEVNGDVWFGADIVLKVSILLPLHQYLVRFGRECQEYVCLTWGKVVIDASPGLTLRIPGGVVLEDEEINDPTDI